MNDSYGRSVVPTQNTINQSMVSMEAEIRKPLNDRQSRTVRVDTTALSFQPFFNVPTVPTSAHMYRPRLEPRTQTFHQVIEKNMAATATTAFQDTWRDTTVQRYQV